MNNKTMLYGLLFAGGLLAFYAWKKNSASKGDATTNTTTASTGTFADDVPVTQSLGVKKDTLLNSINNSVSNIVDPFLGNIKESQPSGQGQFLES
jgi:hypothetical protein